MPSIPVSSSATQQPPGSVSRKCRVRIIQPAPRVAGRSTGSGQERRDIRVSSSWNPSALSRSAAGTSSGRIGRMVTTGVDSVTAPPYGSATMPRMRILVAPDKFAGTLSAVEAAAAIAAGWRRHAPDDELDLAPMSDGGPGFVAVLHAALGGQLLAVTASGPFGTTIPATVLLVDETAYVESAQACGIHLTGGEGTESASTFGVGELVLAAVATG